MAYPQTCDYHVESMKWMNLIGVLWIQALSGTNFDFSGYSSVLKEVLQISQVQLNNLAVASDLGKVIGWISGYAMRRMALWAVMLIATSMGLLGYGLQYLVITQKISLNYSEVYLLCFLCGNSICWLNTVGFTLCIRNFPMRKSMALGLSTSYNALTAAAFTVIVKAISLNGSTLYLLLNALLPLMICTLVLTFIREIPSTIEESSTESPIFITINVIAIMLGLYLLPVDFFNLSSTFSYQMYAMGMVLLLLVPLGIPGIIYVRGLRMNKNEEMGFQGYYSSIPEHDNNCNNDNKGVLEKHECEDLQENVSESSDDNEGKRSFELNCSDPVAGLGEEHNLFQLFRSVDFWLYFFMYLCGATIGLAYSNNLGQIVQSRGYSNSTVFVSLYSSSAFFGRLMSAGPDYFPRAACVGRPGWTCLALVPMCPALFYLAIDNSAPLYISTAIIGMCSGFIISSAVSITSELFGTNSFGVNHNILVANIPLGSLLFGYMAASIYDNNADSNAVQKAEKLGIMVMCMGVKCYRSTFLIWGCICLLGLIFNCILFIRTRNLYMRR